MLESGQRTVTELVLKLSTGKQPFNFRSSSDTCPLICNESEQSPYKDKLKKKNQRQVSLFQICQLFVIITLR